MKATCQQDQLARGLAIVARAVPARSTLPDLADILVATDDASLRLSATNLEVGITCTAPARIDGVGAVTVPARTSPSAKRTPPNGHPLDSYATADAMSRPAVKPQCCTASTPGGVRAVCYPCCINSMSVPSGSLMNASIEPGCPGAGGRRAMTTPLASRSATTCRTSSTQNATCR